MAAGKIDLKARLGKKSLAPGEGAPMGASPSGMPPGQPQGAQPGPGMPGPGMPGPGMPGPGMGAAPGGFGAPQAGFGAQPGASAPPQRAHTGAPLGGGIQPSPGIPVGANRPAPGGSIPAPAGFGPRPTAPNAGPVANNPPVAARPAPVAARPAPPGINVDLGEEMLQAQRATGSKARIMALGAGVVALVVGFGVGSLYNGNEGAKAAIQGAGLLVQDISAANEKAIEMNELLKNAAKKIKGGAFPSEEVEKLGALDIPFDGSNLMNKGVGRYNSTAMTLLLQYSTAVQNAKDQKEKVRRLLGSVKGSLEAQAAAKANPSFHWGVTLQPTPMGPVGKMQMIKPVQVKDAKDEKYRWPKEFEFGTSKQARYEGNELKDEPVMIPVEPETEGLVCSENLAIRAMGAVLDTSRDLEGDQTPGSERAGVIELGRKTMEMLKKINSGGAGEG